MNARAHRGMRIQNPEECPQIIKLNTCCQAKTAAVTKSGSLSSDPQHKVSDEAVRVAFVFRATRPPGWTFACGYSDPSTCTVNSNGSSVFPSRTWKKGWAEAQP